LKCPVIKVPKQLCGAYYRASVACGRFLNTGKCPGDHTPINDRTKENQMIWFDQMETLPNFDFDKKILACFKRVNRKLVRPA
jgi:hypothetical protein